MKIVGPFLFVLLAFFNCHNIKVAKKDEIRGIIFERIVPDIYRDSLKNQYILSNFAPYYTKIYYYKDQVLLQSSYEYRSLNFEGLNEDEILKLSASTPFQIRYFSFVYSNHLNRGWRCDSNNVRSGRIVNKDSLLAHEWISLQQKHDILTENYHTLVSSTTSKDGNITEEYKFRNKKDTTMTGTVILVFSDKLFGVTEFSLAKETEEQKKMKVIKMIVINDARHVPPSNVYIERVELPYELKKITITNEEELIKMFEAAKAALH